MNSSSHHRHSLIFKRARVSPNSHISCNERSAMTTSEFRLECDMDFFRTLDYQSWFEDILV